MEKSTVIAIGMVVCAVILATIIIVATAPKVDAINVYTPIEQPTPALTGHVYFILRVHHNLLSKTIYLSLPGNEPIVLNVRPDGLYDDDFVPGHYRAVLSPGTTMHDEVREFDVIAGREVTVLFEGQAISAEPTAEPTPTPTQEPNCHEERIWHPGCWTWELHYVCYGCHCYWTWVPVYHPGYWTTEIVCTG